MRLICESLRYSIFVPSPLCKVEVLHVEPVSFLQKRQCSLQWSIWGYWISCRSSIGHFCIPLIYKTWFSFASVQVLAHFGRSTFKFSSDTLAKTSCVALITGPNTSCTCNCLCPLQKLPVGGHYILNVAPYSQETAIAMWWIFLPCHQRELPIKHFQECCFLHKETAFIQLSHSFGNYIRFVTQTKDTFFPEELSKFPLSN